MPDDHVPFDRALGTAVIGIVAVITHDKVFALRNGIGAECVQPAGPVRVIYIRLFIQFTVDFRHRPDIIQCKSMDMIVDIGGAKYYFDKKGIMVYKDFVTKDGKTYYFGKDGKMWYGELKRWTSQYYYCDLETGEVKKGFFDYKDEMTILFDIKPNTNSGNFFTFTFGVDTEKYDFFRFRGSEVRNAITVDNYYNEREVKTSFDATDSWMAIALVFDNGKLQLYVNGTLKATNNDAHKVSELGDNLLAYFGKSFYDGDGYFNGLFDNFEVYDKVLSPQMIQDTAKAHLPLLLSVNVGEVVSNLDGVSGTDNHTMVSTSINRGNGEITSIIQRRQDPAAVPVNFISLNDDCTIYVDNAAFTNGSTLDLTSDRSVRIVHGSAEETYTLKAAQIANNPVLPGMYADPDIDVLDDKFWIYPTTDGVPGWGGTQFHAFSSKDMLRSPGRKVL